MFDKLKSLVGLDPKKEWMGLLGGAGVALDQIYFKCSVRDEHMAEARVAAQRVAANAARYKVVGAKTGIDWWVVGIIHYLEGGGNFSACLQNGERIIGTGRKTTLVPRGRGPFATWEESAIDALHGIKIGPRLQDKLDMMERYNGLGYRKHGVPSPYLWSFTTAYTSGKYTSDGSYDSSVVSNQVGCAAIMKALEASGKILGAGLSQPAQPPQGTTMNYSAKVLKLANDVGCGALGARMLTFMGAHEPRYLSIFDVSKPDTAKRLHILDTHDMTVQSITCGVGSGSDPSHSGMATHFSNDEGSKCTSLGVFRYSEITHSDKHGTVCRLDGLESTNSNMRARAVLLHTANYVTDSRAGRTEGCEGIAPDHADIIPKLAGGSFGIIGKA